MKIQKLKSKSKKMIILIFLLLNLSCDTNPTANKVGINNDSFSSSEIKNNLDDDIKTPNGNEISVEIKKTGQLKAEITVHNNSSETVFLPYLAGGEDKYAYYAIFQIEKRNKLSGEFQTYGESHLGTGLRPLSSGDYYKSSIIVNEKGIYRFSVSYIVDETFAKRINNLAQLDKRERILEEEWIIEKRKKASKTITLEPIEL